MKTFKISGWIHPKEGGDDKQFSAQIEAEDIDKARILAKIWLHKRSEVIDDFTLEEMNPEDVIANMTKKELIQTAKHLKMRCVLLTEELDRLKKRV